MEAFLRGLEDNISNSRFIDDASNPDSFDVVESTSQGPLVSKRIALGDLIDWVNDREVQETANTPVPKFKMVHILQDEYKWAPRVSRSIWDAIFDAFHIGTWLQHLAFKQYRGFYQYQKDAMDNVRAFMFDVGRGSVVWWYSATTGCTRAVFYGSSRCGEDLRKGLIWHSGFADHPLFPGFVSAVDDVFISLNDLVHQDAALGRLEKTTGYQAKNILYPNVYEGKGSERLSELSKDAAAISNTINHRWADLNISKQILDFLSDQSDSSSHPLTTPPAVRKDVAGVVSCMLQRIEAEERWKTVSTKRVENQMTIIFNLIAREDTAATIKLAEATKRDSSSMKTLAVMTMAFLPATFLATVFAMPSLTGDKPPGFNVYLSVSIPTTVAILLGWAAITQRQIIRDLLQDVRVGRGATRRKGLKSDVEKMSLEAQSQRSFTGSGQES